MTEEQAAKINLKNDKDKWNNVKVTNKQINKQQRKASKQESLEEAAE